MRIPHMKSTYCGLYMNSFATDIRYNYYYSNRLNPLYIRPFQAGTYMYVFSSIDKIFVSLISEFSFLDNFHVNLVSNDRGLFFQYTN